MNLPILLAILVLSLFATAKTAIAANPTFGPNILISTIGNSNSTSGPPILDVDVAGGVYIAWVGRDSNNSTDVFFSKLSPGGSNFENTEPLTEINNQKSSAQIEEDDGNIYIAWNERRLVDGVVKQGVFFTKSTNQGQTFSEEIFIDTAVDLPLTMAAQDGHIYIAYSVVKVTGCCSSWSEIWIAHSQDHGSTFTKSLVFASPIGVQSDQRPAVDFRGDDVYVSWFDYSGIKFASSNNRGVTFESARYIFKPDNSGISRLGNTFGRMSLETSTSGTIFVAFDFFFAWDSPPRTDYEVYLMKSADSGATFTPALRLSDDPIELRTQQQRPSLTLLPDGSPAIAWLDNRAGGASQKIMFVYSEDQGESFSPNIRINNTEQDRAFFASTIVADNEGKIHLARWDSGLSPFGLYYTKIDLGLQFEITPTPFLDLPWDYESKGLSFTEAALAIRSFFDHEYPLLSSSLLEPFDASGSIISFFGPPRSGESYSRHDGYDYSKKANVFLGDPVLAAAAGCASYFNDGATGNAIKIDHGNDYQTRYYHLSVQDLITQSSDCVNVTKSQQIGRVGATGNVIPSGDLGAHIHFMVVQDKNNDGNFDDNIPDGVTDPFGWQSTELDPWPSFAFSYGGQARTGNKSFYLWTKPIANLSDQLSSNGGFFQLEKYRLEFPEGATDQDLTIDMQMAPIAKPSNLLESLGSTLVVTAKNASGQFVEEFTKPYTISIDFSVFDLSTLNLATISIHSSDDGINWQKEETTVDLETKKASAQLNHLSHFALMAERLDAVVPTTTAILAGSQGQPNWFRSDVLVTLDAQDNSGGLGVDYTLYRIDDGDWQQYFGPETFTQEGIYVIEFYSVDQDENIEQVKSTTFNIDKTKPTANITASPNILWPPNGKLIDVLISGEASDNNQYLIEVEDEYDEFEPTISNFGQTIQLKSSRKEGDKDGRQYKIKVLDLAGNIAESMAEVLVPHDRRNN